MLSLQYLGIIWFDLNIYVHFLNKGVIIFGFYANKNIWYVLIFLLGAYTNPTVNKHKWELLFIARYLYVYFKFYR